MANFEKNEQQAHAYSLTIKYIFSCQVNFTLTQTFFALVFATH